MTQGCKRSYEAKRLKYGSSDKPRGNLLVPKKARPPWNDAQASGTHEGSWSSSWLQEEAPGPSKMAEEEDPCHDQKEKHPDEANEPEHWGWLRKWDEELAKRQRLVLLLPPQQSCPLSASQSQCQQRRAWMPILKKEEELPSDWGWLLKWDKEHATWYWHDGDHTFVWVKPTGPSERSKKKAEEENAVKGWKKAWNETLRKWFWYSLVG